LEVEIDVHRRYLRVLDYEGIPRQHPPTRPIARRIGIAEVEECYSESQARREGARCLQCWTNTVFEQDAAHGTECILCGGCQDICPEAVIDIVPAAAVRLMPAGARELAPLLIEGERAGSILIKDESSCTRCGLCALRCPVGTITMQSFRNKEEARV